MFLGRVSIKLVTLFGYFRKQPNNTLINSFGTRPIKDQMMTFLDDITREISTLGEPRPVYVSIPKYLNLNDLDQNELQEYTAWIKVIVKDIKNNSDAKFDRVFGKNTFGNVKLRSVNSAFGLNPNFVPNLSQLELVGATQLNH